MSVNTVPTDELLPCPFCGAGGINVEVAEMMNDRGDRQWFEVCCEECQCSGPAFMFDPEADQEFEKKAEAIAAWNRRTPTASAKSEAGIKNDSD